jgi:hypothetical protein
MHVLTRRSQSRMLLAEQRLCQAVKLNGSSMFTKTAAVLPFGTIALAPGHGVNVFAAAQVGYGGSVGCVLARPAIKAV